MFFQEVYSSWEQTQMEKYEEIVDAVGKDFFKGKILDIGAGLLFFEEFLKNKGINANIIAADIDKKSLSEAEIDVFRVVANGNFLPFEDSCFDIVISFDTMHLVKNNDFRNVLKKNGFVLFSLFFNETNKEEKKRLLKEKLVGFMTVKEFEIPGKENEYVIVGKKIGD